MKRSPLVGFLALSLLASCSAPPAEQGGAAPSAQALEAREVPASPAYRNAALGAEERARDLLSYMSLEEKIGQMTQAARDYIASPEEVTERGLGSILSGGGSSPSPNTPASWAAMYDSYQKAALATRLGIPMIYGIDSVHGNNNLFGAVIFPHNIGLGATRNPDLVRAVALATAVETDAVGIDWTFAPCVAVPQDERWGRTYEGFSEDTALVAQLGAAAVQGYQGKDGIGKTKDSILATAKHYLGDGGTTGGVDQGDTDMDEATLRALFLPPYKSAIDAGAGSVMVSFSSWQGAKLHGHSYLINDVLKKELGFKGFVVSDWAGVKQLPGTPSKQIESAINAGIDMVMVPDDWKSFMGILKKLAQEGKVPLGRIDDAVLRILTIKFQLGLFEAPLSDPARLTLVGSKEHRELARQAVRESLVVLKNEAVLPLKKSGVTIALVGEAADNIGLQCGGWTMTWQGQSGPITPGTTILEAMKAALGNKAKLVHSVDGSDIQKADVAIVVAAEAPYAEMKGDDPRLDFPTDAAQQIASLRGKGIPVVTVLMSGRPLVLGDVLKNSGAFVTAWLPGTQAEGIVDVLFGDHAPRGTLPYTWFDSVDAIPINSNGPGKGVLFPAGFGLSW